MTSQITSSSIDENFPVAGQDNDSQGFRDNFFIIKDGLATAASEISVLQLDTVKINSPNNFNGSLLENAITNQLYGKVFPIVTSGTTTIDYTSGEYHIVTVSGNHALRFVGFAGSDEEPVYAKIRLELSPNNLAGSTGWNVTFNTLAGGSVIGTVGFPTPGQNPTINVGNNADSKTIVDVWTTNGKDFYADLVVSPKQGFYTGSENLEASTAASTGVSASYFSTAAAETSTLAAGVEGQIKTFAMFADSGNMVITVTNAGWKSASTGTITFDTIGQACTLQYLNGKWFCVGNNGAVFA